MPRQPSEPEMVKVGPRSSFQGALKLSKVTLSIEMPLPTDYLPYRGVKPNALIYQLSDRGCCVSM